MGLLKSFFGTSRFFDMAYVVLRILCSILLLLDTSEEFCGQPFFKPIFSTEDQIENRISNGIEARIHSHPWQALVIVSESGSVVSCGGSLINWKNENASDFVLTAAHCIIDWLRFEKPETVWQKMKHYFSRLFKRYEGVPLAHVSDVIVYLGLHDLTQLSSVTKRLEVFAMAAGDFEVSTASGDIGLLKLEKEVTYNAAIQGVCLPTENEGLPRPESPCLVAGWGLLQNGRRTATLQQFQTYILDSQLVTPRFRKGHMICSRSKTKDTGVRKGDSGGPLVCLRNNEFVIYGVVSLRFTRKCSGLDDKQAFTKVSQHLSWLREKIAKLNA